MRRIALALLLVALAAPAAAQPKKIVVPAAPKASPTRPTPPTRPITPSPTIARFTAAAKTDPTACSQSCARDYYFCQAGGDEDCGAVWSQCRAKCTRGTSAPLSTPLPR